MTPFMYIRLRIIQWILFWIGTLGWSLRIRGRQNVPRKGAVLFLGNHVSALDPPLVGTCSPRWVIYLARKSLFGNRFFGPFIRWYGAVPLDRDVGTEGLKVALAQLEAGSAVVMFPEGTRSETGQLQPLKPGVVLLLKRANCRIVPVGIAGMIHAWPRGQALPNFAPLFLAPQPGTIAIEYGESYSSERYRTMDRDAILADLSRELAEVSARAEAIRRKPK